MPSRRTRYATGPAKRRFLRYLTLDPSGCLLWDGGVNANGYGVFCPTGTRQRLAHRWWYEQQVGEIPEGLTLDHLCRVRRCVLPEHLEPVTRSENTSRTYREDTTCRSGRHPWVEENIKRRPSRPQYRECKACASERAAR